MALPHIKSCPLDPFGMYLYSTDDPDVIMEVTLHAKELSIADLSAEIESLESQEAPMEIPIPPQAPMALVEAIIVFNMMNDQSRQTVESGKKLAKELRKILDKVKSIRGR